MTSQNGVSQVILNFKNNLGADHIKSVRREALGKVKSGPKLGFFGG